MSLNPLTVEILSNHPKLTLEVLDALPPKEIAALLRRVPPPLALRMVLPLSHWKATQTLDILPKTTANGLFGAATPEQCLQILRKIPKSVHSKFLELLEDEKRKVAKLLLSYPEDSVGAWMNPAPLSALPKNTVYEVLATMHETRKIVSEKILTIYVVDENNNFKGALSVSDLLQVNPESPLRRVMQKKIRVLAPYNSLSLIDTLKEWQDFPSLPVIDPDMGLIGELSQTDLRKAQQSMKPKEDRLAPQTTNPLWDNLDAVDAFVSGVVDMLPKKNEKE